LFVVVAVPVNTPLVSEPNVITYWNTSPLAMARIGLLEPTPCRGRSAPGALINDCRIFCMSKIASPDWLAVCLISA